MENAGLRMPASRTDPDHPWVRWAQASMAKSLGKQVQIIPNSSGGLPGDVFVDHLHVPLVWVPHSYNGCKQHGPDEHYLIAPAREGHPGLRRNVVGSGRGGHTLTTVGLPFLTLSSVLRNARVTQRGQFPVSGVRPQTEGNRDHAKDNDCGAERGASGRQCRPGGGAARRRVGLVVPVGRAGRVAASTGSIMPATVPAAS